MYEKEIETARRAGLAAAARIIELDRPDVEVRWKGENDPVTAADLASTEAILETLGRAFPDDPVLIEEKTDDGARLSSSRVWIVDPLDGTREFIDRIPEFCVMIGLVEDGRPVLGVVHVPLTGVAFQGVAGGPALRIDPDGTETPLTCNPAGSIESMRLVVSRSHRSDAITRAKEILGITEEVPSGSVGMKVARLVTGEADLYIHLGPGIKLWDACAPDAILAAAGGRMTDPSGTAIDYAARSVHCPTGLLATTGALHDEIADRIAEVV
jgi:3'(2'), 5'-bisphosphate nucleotidase